MPACKPTLLHYYTKMRVNADVTSTGGVLPCLNASFLAGNTTLPTAEFVQETQVQRATSHEKYCGPSDVWHDSPFMEYLKKGSIAPDTPSHDIRRV